MNARARRARARPRRGRGSTAGAAPRRGGLVHWAVWFFVCTARAPQTFNSRMVCHRASRPRTQVRVGALGWRPGRACPSSLSESRCFPLPRAPIPSPHPFALGTPHAPS